MSNSPLLMDVVEGMLKEVLEFALYFSSVVGVIVDADAVDNIVDSLVVTSVVGCELVVEADLKEC